LRRAVRTAAANAKGKAEAGSGTAGAKVTSSTRTVLAEVEVVKDWTFTRTLAAPAIGVKGPLLNSLYVLGVNRDSAAERLHRPDYFGHLIGGTVEIEFYVCGRL
jgi:hypothetical protein